MDSISRFLKNLRGHEGKIALLAILVIMLFILNPIFGTVGLILAIIMVTELLQEEERIRSQRVEEIESLREDFDSAAQDAIFNMPFPLIMTDEEGIVSWYNPNFLRLVDEESLVDYHIDSIIDGFDFDKNKDLNEPQDLVLGDTSFIVYKNSIKKKSGHMVHIFYLVDNSQVEVIKKAYNDTKVSFGHIYVDNYDELTLSRSQGSSRIKSVVMANIDSEVISYFSSHGAIVRKYDDEKYLAVFLKENLKSMIEDRFSILDTVRDMTKEDEQNITLSIGISKASNDLQNSYEESRSAIDLALSRGGDQAVITTDTGQEFFGGTSQAREKRNRVRARVIGSSLKNLIEKHKSIFIMGHKNADMDAIGAAIGMLGVSRRMGKEAYIVLNDVNPSIKLIVDAFYEEEPDYAQYIIGEEDAFSLADRLESMIILVDNHSIKSAESEELFDHIDTVVIIDHHRMTSGAITDPVLSYIEPYASSTSELVTEILEFIEPQMNLSSFEAEALMAGIVVDTKNFSYQTGVRTFEAASTLRSSGANLSNVKTYFDDDYRAVKARAKVVQESQIIREEIAVGVLEDHSDMSILVAAQAADELLSIHGIKASFVISQMDDYIHISGRSTGDISVQLIMEDLGGGGHLVSAATQIYDKSIEEVRSLLLDAIEKYYKEIKETEDESNTN